MANTELDVLKSRLDELKESMSAIRSKAASICGAIDSDALIPAVVAEELTAAISDYQQKEEQIRAIGDSLSIPIGATISEISESIRTREESLHLDRFRDIVLDYFRLNADAAELKSVLESTKLALIEKCTTPVSDIAEELAPYELVVSSVKGEKGPLSFKDSAPIRKNISDEIAYAVVSRELFFDDSIELAKYADGSCPLLTIPVDPAVVQEEVAVPEQNAEPANAGAVEEPTEAHSTDRRRWPDFGGYLSDGDSVSFTDNMATAEIDEVRRLDQDHPDCLLALWNIAHEKLLSLEALQSTGSRVFSSDAFKLLTEKGFLSEIQININSVSRSFYTLTSKGWSCFTSTSTKNFLSKKDIPLSVPDKLCIPVSSWTPSFAAKAVCIHNYFRLLHQDYDLWYDIDKSLIISKSTERPDTTVFAGLFAEGDEGTDLQHFSAAIDALPENERAIIIARTERDVEVLRQEFTPILNQAFLFAVEDRDYVLLDCQGNAIASNPAGADSADQVTEEEDIVPDEATLSPGARFALRMKEAGVLQDSDSAFGKLTVDISPAETKKIQASIFTNDIRNGSRKAESQIIRQIVSLNAVTVSQMVAVYPIPQDIAEFNLDYLYKRGYLRKYTLVPGGEFFCASIRLQKALTQQASSQLLGMNKRPLSDWGEPAEDSASCAATRLAMSNTYELCIERQKNAEVEKRSEVVTTSSRAYILSVFDSDHKSDYDLIIGAFWEKTEEEFDMFLGHLEKQLAHVDRIARITIAGINKTVAKALADSILATTDISKYNAPIFLYGLSEDSYYSYSDLTAISREKLADPSFIPSQAEPAHEDEEQDNPPLVEGQTTADSAEPGDDSGKHDDTSSIGGEVVKEEEEPETAKVQQPGVRASEAIASAPPKQDIASEMENLYKMLLGGKIYAATAYAKAYSMRDQKMLALYRLLAHAINDPAAHCTYNSDNAFALIGTDNAFDEALTIATALRLFFSNQTRYDFRITAFYDAVKNSSLLGRIPALGKALHTLWEFKDTQKKGMDAFAGYHSKNQNELDAEIAKLRKDAREFYDNFVVGRKKEKASQRRFLETKKLMFSVNSDLGMFIKAVVDDERDAIPLVKEYLQEHFFKQDSTIDVDTIDDEMLWDYINGYWDKAGEAMMLRKRSDLMSHLRTNIITMTSKAVQFLARWCNLAEEVSSRSQDDAALAYKKIKKPVSDDLREAASILRDLVDNQALTVDDRAGLQVVLYTAEELVSFIDGTYSEIGRKYFYAPFLLTDDVTLDDAYNPDFEVHSSVLTVLQPEYRILSHFQKVTASTLTYEARLKEILDDKGDDCGSARLIVAFLTDSGAEEINAATELSTIDASERYAKETADIRKEDFIGELELAQSFGQIDNSVENQKEKILQIIEEWYEWAVETANFGFFKKVLDSYLLDIRKNAKAREADLLKQLERFRSTSIQGVAEEAKERRAARILKAIKDQDYTSAEDLLNRRDDIDAEQDGIIEEDFLKEFLDNYDDFYQPVAKRAPFSSLVSSRTRNKEERGGKRLADNWLPGGSRLGKEHLEALLSGLGFYVASIKEQPDVGRFENYTVLMQSTIDGKRVNFSHPIAAFGSGSTQEGFRVVCLNGNYDADGLISIMQQVGNAKHTLVLLDAALTKGERRRLARKAKTDLGDKLFAVLDRSVMMFLVRNYDETKINRMFISLTAPFGYYQPYVWDSSTPMPPEIFMGRKHELERIESASGVNIVYGGRQLGKSALLKKAKEDIDRDENGDRAVYVDIKGLNYEEAARKIGHELYDTGILDKDIDTTDWAVLARAVRQRLQSGHHRIPYLLLLIDEADTFIESCEAVNYKPFDSLKDIQGVGIGRFKFVIAGLRNIVRFRKEAALSNNSVLTHLDAMTVKPFSYSEARELMEIPLHYLGLRFPKEKESLITLILASTNYFPGLIQLYCAKLLEAMRNKDYAGYDEVDTPVYEVNEKHIKKVLADSEFMEQIREKYVITLKLDEDNYYYLIALLMAYLYHANGYSTGYSVEDVKRIGSELDITKISNLDDTKLAAFMEELEELNVLRRTDETHYLFTRFTFFQMMGTSSEVEDKLVEYMGA